MALPLLPMLIAACGVLVIVGSTGPWARIAGFFVVKGTDGDGTYTLMLGAFAGIMGVVRLARPALRLASIGAAAAFLLALFIGVYNLTNVPKIAEWGDAPPLLANLLNLEIDPGWGIITTVAMSAAGLVVAVVDVARTRFAAARPAV